jgi:hypothetical protein
MEQAIEALRLLTAEVENGDRAALRTFIEFKRLEKELKAAMEIVQPLAVDEAQKFDGRSFEHFGAKIEVKNAASRWDYAGVTAVNHAQDRLKLYQQLAQNAAMAGQEIYDGDGTVIQPAKKIEGATTIAVSVK